MKYHTKATVHTCFKIHFTTDNEQTRQEPSLEISTVSVLMKFCYFLTIGEIFGHFKKFCFKKKYAKQFLLAQTELNTEMK